MEIGERDLAASAEEIIAKSDLVKTKTLVLNSIIRAGNLKEMSKRAKELLSLSEELKELIALSDECDKEETTKVADNAKKEAKLLLAAIDVEPGFTDDNEKPTAGGSDFKSVKLKTPSFSGDLKEWRSWWEQFSLSIHGTQKSETEKFLHLSNVLQGKAKKAIEGYSITSENYPKVITLLHERFGDPRRLQAVYFDELDALKLATTAEENRTNHDAVQKILTNLTSINTDTDQDILRKMVLQKYSASVLTNTLRSLPKIYTLSEFLAAATREIELLEELESVYRFQYQSQKTESEERPSTSRATTAALVGGSRPNDAKRPMTCKFCKNTHLTQDCRRYPTIQARTERASKMNLCFVCLNNGHSKHRCYYRSQACAYCKQSGHQIALCDEYLNRNRGNTNNKDDKKGTFLLSFICRVRGKIRNEEVRGFVDQGSYHSYILSDLARRLDLQICERSKVGLFRFKSEEPEYFNSSRVLVPIENYRAQVRSLPMQTTDCITGKFQSAPEPEIVSLVLPPKFKYADPSIFLEAQAGFSILIGNDLYHSIIDIHRSKELLNGVTLLNSYFGWIPSGPINSLDETNGTKIRRNAATLLAASSLSQQEIEVLTPNPNEILTSLERLWSLEALGIKSSELTSIDQIIINEFRETVIFENNRYTVRWPWKTPNTTLDSNYRMCMARLKSLINRYEPDILGRCHDYFMSQLQDGIIEEAPQSTPYITHYLPHKPVFQKEKIRIVYDASAKTKNGRSLNDSLHAGPVLTKNLVGLLLSFRINPVALVADIEKAFLMVGLNPIDRDSVRFLWLRDPEKPPEKGNLIVYRFTRVPFGVISSPFLLNMVIQEALTNSGPENTWHTLASQSFYVDNLVISVQDSITASRFFESLVSKMSSISFNLRDWLSNDDQFLATVPENLRHKEKIVSVLGLTWDATKDVFSLKYDFDEIQSELTKRKALQFYASVFDPLGLVAPATLPLKVFIQLCWRDKFEWDKKLPVELEARWAKLLAEARELKSVRIPRRLWPNLSEGEISLHVFCDASKQAFACCAYLCVNNVITFQAESALAFCKVRLAPIKELSVPRLELLAVWLGKRTANFLRSELKVHLTKVVLWTDATTVLQWLQSSVVQPTFVRNRLDEIRKAPNFEIRYVPTKQNPADVATRGCKPSVLQQDSLWWNGPPWLSNEKLWPRAPENTETYHSSGDRDPVACLITPVSKYQGYLSDSLETRYSSWNKYIRLFSRVLRYTFSTVSHPKLSHVSDGELYSITERFLLLEIQRKYFASELQQLKSGLQPNKDLELFLDLHGLIRCKGRLQNARLPWDTIHPILLPRKSPLVRTIVEEMHREKFHIGCNHLLANLRERFWIIKGRAFVKSILHRCVACKRWTGGAYKLPPLPPLPLVRVAEVAPFLHTGLDNLGPLNIDRGDGECVKCYVTLFTCLVTRAIHLELVRDQTAEEFLLALSRFTSRRGMPRFIMSDNATNFVAVQPLVGTKVTLQNVRLNNFVSSNRIQWHFIPQYAPWYGGAYERLVGLVKNCLKKSLGFLFYDYVRLTTALNQIEDTINSRPLTYVSDELLAPLTPNHFLRLRTVNVNEMLEPTDEMLSSTPGNLGTSWRMITRVVEAFWSVFRSEYLLSLRERHTSRHPTKKGSAPFLPRKGEIVLVKESSVPRGEWKYAQIVKVDARQALAHIRYKGKTQIRSVNQLYPLEVSPPPRP